MPHTIDQLTNSLNEIPRSRMAEQLYISGFKKSDCNYDNLHLTWATDPLSKDYYSILNPCFTYEPKTPELLNSHPCWLVRDGALSLVNALYNNQFDGVASTLLFPRGLQSLLPQKIQEKALYYDLVSNRERNEDPKKVLIYTLVNGAYCSPEYFIKILNLAKKKHPKLAPKDFHIMTLLRENQFYQVAADAVHPAYQFPKIIQEHMPEATLISESDFDKIDDFSNWQFIDANENSLVIGDNYLNHHILSRGATLLTPEIEYPDCHLFLQSPNHSIRVGSATKVMPSLFEEAKTVIEHMNENEVKIKNAWTPPYAKNPTFGCFYQWVKEALANE